MKLYLSILIIRSWRGRVVVSKKLAFFVFSLLVVIFAFAGFSYLNSFKEITIQLPNSEQRTVEIHEVLDGVDLHNSSLSESEDSLVKTLGSTGDLKLRVGDYIVYAAENDEYAELKAPFSVSSNNEVVNVSYIYSEKRLSTLLEEQYEEIRLALRERYKKTIVSYDLAKGSLYGTGKWYYSTLRKKQTKEEERLSYSDIFRVVMKRDDTGWTVVAHPQLTISRVLYPDIPDELIDSVNNLN